MRPSPQDLCAHPTARIAGQRIGLPDYYPNGRNPIATASPEAWIYRAFSPSSVFGVEMGQDLLPHHFDDPHDLGAFHAGPAHAEDQVVRLQPFNAALDF